MGKGGCFDIFDAGVGMIRGIIGCICCLLCVGPILIIVGIVVILAPNNFAENTQKYKDAISAFDSDIRPLFRAANGTEASGSIYARANSQTYTMSYYSEQVPIKGVNKDKLPTFDSALLRSNNNVRFTTFSSDYATISGVRNTKMFSAMTTSMQVGPFRSSSRQSANSNPSCRNDNDCRSNEYEEYCHEHFGDNSYASGRTCYWYEREKYFCRVVTASSSNFWSVSTSKTTCDYIDGKKTPMGSFSETSTKYKFTRNPLEIYSSSSSLPSYVYTYVRDSKDPYLLAAELTDGTFDFGLTATQQRVLGLVLVIIGALFVACLIGAIVTVRRMMNRDPRNGAAMYGAVGRTYQPSGGYQAMPPGTYGGVQYNEQGPYQGGAPQSGYQQMPPPQQPGYGQPQPQPGYGQAPPPQQGYGQPQPGPGYPPPEQQCQPAPMPPPQQQTAAYAAV